MAKTLMVYDDFKKSYQCFGLFFPVCVFVRLRMGLSYMCNM